MLVIVFIKCDLFAINIQIIFSTEDYWSDRFD